MSRPHDTSWHEKFLKAYAETDMIGEAAKIAGVTRQTVHNHRQKFEEFALAFADAQESSTEGLEREAIRRAKESSDVLLIFMLKSRRPQVYRDNVKVEHSGAVRHDYAQMTDEQLDEIERRLAG